MLTKEKRGAKIRHAFGKESSEGHEESSEKEILKNFQKPLDKAETKWYTCKAVCEERAAVNLEN